MTEPAVESRPIRWIVPAALFLGVAAAIYAWVALRPAPPPGGESAAVPETGEIEDPVTRALRLAGIDSTRKNEWVDDVPGVDVAMLGDARRERFVRLANTERCPCGCGFTLAACRRFDPTCEDSAPRVAALFDSVAAGHYDRATGLRARPEPGASPH